MLDKLKNVLYRPQFFEAQAFTMGQGMKFYSLSIFILSAAILVTLLPGMVRTIHSMRSGDWGEQNTIVRNLFPPELKVTYTDNTVSTNSETPTVIPVPQEWHDRDDCRRPRCVRDEALPTNLIVIDTDATVSQETLRTYDTLVLLTAHEAGFRNPERGETRIYNLSEAKIKENFSVTGSQLARWTDRGFAVAKTVVLICMVMFPFFLYVGLWIGYLVYSFFGALVVWLAASIGKHSLGYGRAYRSTLYLLPAPFAVLFFMSATHVRLPLVFTLVLFLMALLNFPRVATVPPVTTPEPTPVPPTPTPATPMTPHRPDEAKTL